MAELWNFVEGATVTLTIHTRRSCLAVPGNNQKMIGKAAQLASDEVFLDLEDSVPPHAKADARKITVEGLNAPGLGTRVRAVRVNDLSTTWTLGDVVEVVEGAGANLDAIILPKVETSAQVAWLDLTLTQVERAAGLDVGRIGIEAMIETASGIMHVDAIAAASPRLEAIVFGPADFMASINMKALVVGEQPPGYDVGDAYHYPLMRILMAARAHGVQAIDGGYLQVRDVGGLRRVAARSAALGFDGKWAMHPGQLDPINAAFSPRQADYDHAELILEAYAYYTSEAGGARGSAMLGEEMIDEASRKIALVIAGKGRAAGLARTERFDPPR